MSAHVEELAVGTEGPERVIELHFSQRMGPKIEPSDSLPPTTTQRDVLYKFC